MNRSQSPITLVAAQRWKLWLWAIVISFPVIGMYAPDQLAHALNLEREDVTISGIFVVFFVLAGASMSIRCPACGLSLAWYALSKQAHHAWLSWLLDVAVCPQCGFSHSSGKEINHEK